MATAARKKVAAPVKRAAAATKKKKEAALPPVVSGRRKLQPEKGSYFTQGSDKDGLKFVSSGCAMYDNVLGGGYVLGRVANLVGDKSSGKTLAAIEACANFARTYPDGFIRYAEAEAAFDEAYAAELGMPIERATFSDQMETIEDFYEDLLKTLEDNKDRPGIYVLDSLDALSDKAEQERGISDSSYGGSKPKKLGELFRRLVQKIEDSQCLVIIISQIRDKLNVTFGETKTRSGGRALDFYASQVVWFAEIGKIKKTIDKVERVIGIDVKAQCKKNKIGLPFRNCEFPILFGYGVDDLTASAEWLMEVAPERLAEIGLSKNGYKVRINNLRNKGGVEVQELREQLNVRAKQEWARIETAFLPQAKKY